MPEINKTEEISIRWIIILVIIALFVFVALFFINNPGTIEDIWLWVIGLAGPIIAIFRNVTSKISSFFHFSKKENNANVNTNIKIADNNYKQEVNTLTQKISKLENELKKRNTSSEDNFNGLTVTVLRYFDDGETTLGLLFLENKFFCYTLEDTFQEIKVKGKTRIPGGTYKLNFRREETGLTKKYRETRPWFDYHLEIKNVPDFSGVYIHCGSTHEDTEGCLLIADSIYSYDEKRTIFNSQKTFERFYKYLKTKLDEGEYARIKILDETWFNKI